MAVRWPEVQKRTITSPIPRNTTRLREPGIHFPPRTAEMRPDAPVAPFLATTTMIRTPTATMRRPQRFMSALFDQVQHHEADADDQDPPFAAHASALAFSPMGPTLAPSSTTVRKCTKWRTNRLMPRKTMITNAGELPGCNGLAMALATMDE